MDFYHLCYPAYRIVRNLMKWNSGKLIDKSCTKNVALESSNVIFDGRRTSYGFCLVWIEPPEKRKFKD
ncbi:DUF6753 family protein [Argonema antarcticum]|uniref:DUF6753 family protein n=1 Tax=Argonema antarcticum TaxID=2942763 RepID=UPI003B8475E0